MKSLFAFLLALVMSAATAAADDMEDARKAFATLLEYQKTDDERAPDLYAKDCLIVMTVTAGEKEQSITIPTKDFIDGMKREIAKKKGSRETYDEIRYTKQTTGVKVTANVHNPDQARPLIFTGVYRRGEDGILRLHEYRLTFQK